MPDGTQDTTAVADKATTVADTTTTTVADKATTVADKATTTDTVPVVKPDWPDDWVKKISQDEAVQGRLSRYASPKAVAEALIAAQNKISSGELKARVDFPAKGTAEEQAAWRADNGVPVAPDKYDLKFDKGLVVGEKDKPIVDDFLKAAHAANLPTGAAKTAVEWYFKTLEETAQLRQQKDAEAGEATTLALRSEWGGEYAGMRNRIKTLAQQLPPEVYTQMMDARFSDGTAIFNNPDVMRWFGGMAKILIPNSTIVPGDDAAIAAQVETRMATIEKLMKNPRSEYWKGPESKKMQEEYRGLIEHKAATKPK